jgi:DNA-binding NarL/FixJ family response regulator
MTVKVLIVDDQNLVRAGLRMVLEAEPDIRVVGEAANGREAIESAPLLDPHVILMDIRMPELDGLEATRRLVADKRCQSRILVLTTFDLDEYVFESLRVGASGFMLKDAPPEHLIAAVRTVAAGDALLAPAVTERVITAFAQQPDLRPPRELDELTPRELEVFKLIARGLSNAEIAATLFLGETTIKTHVAHILSKLGLRDRVQAVVLAYEAGVVQPGDSTTEPDAP